MESIRIKTKDYEMILAQIGNFTVIATQTPHKLDVKVDSEKKEGEAEAKKE